MPPTADEWHTTADKKVLWWMDLVRAPRSILCAVRIVLPMPLSSICAVITSSGMSWARWEVQSPYGAFGEALRAPHVLHSQRARSLNKRWPRRVQPRTKCKFVLEQETDCEASPSSFFCERYPENYRLPSHEPLWLLCRFQSSRSCSLHHAHVVQAFGRVGPNTRFTVVCPVTAWYVPV